jgi:predicted  nucleic acid-binding Zn-ribbon protein
MSIQRICKCGCNKVFAPPASRPGQEYLHGHKPRTGKALGTPARRTETERHTLDYKLAQATAHREMSSVESAMDALDEKIVPLQKQLAELQREKERLHDRHLTLAATAEALDAAATGKSLAQQLEAQ